MCEKKRSVNNLRRNCISRVLISQVLIAFDLSCTIRAEGTAKKESCGKNSAILLLDMRSTRATRVGFHCQKAFLALSQFG